MPRPAELQNYTVFNAASAWLEGLVGAKTLIKFLHAVRRRRVQGEGAGGGVKHGALDIQRTETPHGEDTVWRDSGVGWDFCVGSFFARGLVVRPIYWAASGS